MSYARINALSRLGSFLGLAVMAAIVFGLAGCATCERYPTACKVGVAVAVVVVTGEAYALAAKHDHNTDTQVTLGRPGPPAPPPPAPGCVGYQCAT